MNGRSGMSAPDRESLPYRDCVGMRRVQPRGQGLHRPPHARAEDPRTSPRSRRPGRCRRAASTRARTRSTAALRELFEETIDPLASSSSPKRRSWLYYDLPDEALGIALKGKYRGQRQRWFAFAFTGEDSEIDVARPGGGEHPAEFDAWRWEELDATARA